MKLIILKRTPQGWIAKFIGEGADEIQNLFGTTEIPTAYTAQANGIDVKEAIQKLNPEHTIRLV